MGAAALAAPPASGVVAPAAVAPAPSVDAAVVDAAVVVAAVVVAAVVGAVVGLVVVAAPGAPGAPPPPLAAAGVPLPVRSGPSAPGAALVGAGMLGAAGLTWNIPGSGMRALIVSHCATRAAPGLLCGSIPRGRGVIGPATALRRADQASVAPPASPSRVGAGGGAVAVTGRGAGTSRVSPTAASGVGTGGVGGRAGAPAGAAAGGVAAVGGVVGAAPGRGALAAGVAPGPRASATGPGGVPRGGRPAGPLAGAPVAVAFPRAATNPCVSARVWLSAPFFAGASGRAAPRGASIRFTSRSTRGFRPGTPATSGVASPASGASSASAVGSRFSIRVPILRGRHHAPSSRSAQNHQARTVRPICRR
jgi:hypothetical protein